MKREIKFPLPDWTDSGVPTIPPDEINSQVSSVYVPMYNDEDSPRTWLVKLGNKFIF